jgi:hypothetical protein
MSPLGGARLGMMGARQRPAKAASSVGLTVTYGRLCYRRAPLVMIFCYTPFVAFRSHELITGVLT